MVECALGSLRPLFLFQGDLTNTVGKQPAMETAEEELLDLLTCHRSATDQKLIDLRNKSVVRVPWWFMMISIHEKIQHFPW